jgi:hypothetical protein
VYYLIYPLGTQRVQVSIGYGRVRVEFHTRGYMYGYKFLDNVSFGIVIAIWESIDFRNEISYVGQNQGGLWVEVLDIKNKCLSSKWLFKILNEQGVWQELIKNKYLHSKLLSQVLPRPCNSPL